MASTSTGYARSLISREQPSSSGQVETFSSGCILNVNAGAKLNLSGKVEINSGATMDIESGGIMTVASGGKVNAESGSTINIQSGAVLNLNAGGRLKHPTVAQSSGAKSMSRTGISFFSSAVAAANTITLDAAPSSGLVKSMVFFTTLAQTIRGASAVASKIYFGGSTAGQYFSFTVTMTSKQQIVGHRVDLIGRSTKLWHVCPMDTTAYVAFTTACT